MTQYSNSVHRELHKIVLATLPNPTKGVHLTVAAMHTAMVDAVNVYRSRSGWASASLADVVRVEQFALGHSDYDTKFALYCCELADYEFPSQVGF